MSNSIALPGSKIPAKDIKCSDLMKIVSAVDVTTTTANGVVHGMIQDGSIVELVLLKDPTFEKDWGDLIITKTVYATLAKALQNSISNK